MNRRSFITGMAGILASGMAPAAVGSGILMPVRDIWRARDFDSVRYTELWNMGRVRIVPYDPRDAEVAKVLESALQQMQEICGLTPHMLAQAQREYPWAKPLALTQLAQDRFFDGAKWES